MDEQTDRQMNKALFYACLNECIRNSKKSCTITEHIRKKNVNLSTILIEYLKIIASTLIKIMSFNQAITFEKLS